MKPCVTIKDQLKINRFIIPYRAYGTSGPFIVCINGVQQSMAMWQSFIHYFSPAYRIVLFDFPGQGKGSVITGPQNISLDEQVEILHEVVNATDAHNITICSASWGGVVALALAAKYPQLIKQLVLGSLGTKPNTRMIETIQTGFQIDPNKRDEMAQTLIESFGENLPDAVKKKIARQFAGMSQEQLDSFCEHGLFIIAAKNLTDVIDLKKIRAKTVLINGENDTIIDLDDVKYLASQIPHCHLKIVKDVGHFLHLENDAVLDVYNQALRK